MMDLDSARKTMVDTQLRPSGITDDRLIATMLRVPREKFIPEDMQTIAYSDTELKLPGGRTMPSPAVFAKLVQLAEIKSTDVVLDVGCGTGYSTAVIAELANAVVAIENDAGLVETSNTVLADLDIGNAAIVEADLSKGMASEAPFDVIILEGAVDNVSPELFDQLKEGGSLVAMVYDRGVPTAEVHLRTGDSISMRKDFNMAFPALEDLQTVPEFTF